MHCRTIGFHQVTAIGLLLVTDLHHENFDFHAEERARHRQRRPPLPSSRLGRELLDTFLLVVEGLSHGGIRLVATDRADTLVLVVNAGGSVQRFLQPARPEEWGGSPLHIHLANRLWNFNVAFGTYFLHNQRHGKQRSQGVRCNGLPGAWVQDSRPWALHIPYHIIPRTRNLLFT